MKGALFVYLMTYGGAVAALFNPFVGLLIYVSFAVLRPEYVWPWSVEPGNYSRIIGLALLAGWAFRGFGQWDLGRGKAVILALIGYFAWTILSALKAPGSKSRVGIRRDVRQDHTANPGRDHHDQLGSSAQAPGMGHPPQSSLPRLRIEHDVFWGLQPAQGRRLRLHG